MLPASSCHRAGGVTQTSGPVARRLSFTTCCRNIHVRRAPRLLGRTGCLRASVRRRHWARVRRRPDQTGKKIVACISRHASSQTWPRERRNRDRSSIGEPRGAPGNHGLREIRSEPSDASTTDSSARFRRSCALTVYYLRKAAEVRGATAAGYRRHATAWPRDDMAVPGANPKFQLVWSALALRAKWTENLGLSAFTFRRPLSSSTRMCSSYPRDRGPARDRIGFLPRA
jgi:hypothetical protein